MNPPPWIVKFLPSLLIVVMLGAGLVYLATRQWWRAVYWFSGAALNIAVTYGF